MTLERISPAPVTTAAQVSSQLVSMARITRAPPVSVLRPGVVRPGAHHQAVFVELHRLDGQTPADRSVVQRDRRRAGQGREQIEVQLGEGGEAEPEVLAQRIAA